MTWGTIGNLQDMQNMRDLQGRQNESGMREGEGQSEKGQE